MMSTLRWLCGVAFAVRAASEATDVRDNNGGNCDGLQSCRPRCITFRIDRDNQECDSSEGIFTVDSATNPWDVSKFETFNCEPACVNNLCGLDLFGDLTVRIGEFGDSGSLYYSSIFVPGDGEERFTYCSVYPCPKDECAVPEQMGSRLQIDFLPGVVNLDEEAEYVLRLEMHLKQDFVGSTIHGTGRNRFGPLHLEWMDDPTGCRDGDFSQYAPVTPEPDPTILTTTAQLPQSRYCSGTEYDPTPLPGTRPPTSPSLSPSFAPSASAAPTFLSAVQVHQLDALETFYISTRMDLAASASRHDWFSADLDYCSWKGITCDNEDYVTSIDLTVTRLSGSLPTEIGNFSRLRYLKLLNNSIGGTIPTELAKLASLTNVLLGTNEFVGDIPTELGSLTKLRRLMLQHTLLSGTIPEELCNIGNSMLAFDISGSVHMYGEIPACFGTQFTSMEALRVDNVGLVGKVPDELCDVMPFNGLNPNLLGCWAIACPAGTYEPVYGREDGVETECTSCHPVASNVIGSKTCKVVDGNTVLTMAPTVSLVPSVQPSVSPSALPSVVPSAGPVGSSPSHEPSVGPSLSSPVDMDDLPSDSPSAAPPSTVPSASPTLSTTTIYATVLFYNVSSHMTQVSEIETFERITRDYLQADDTVSTNVKEVDVINQSLRVPTQDDVVVSIQNPHASSRLRSLQSDNQDEDEALFVAMQVRGDAVSNDDEFEKAVVSSLTKMDDYQSALSDGGLDLFATSKIPDEPAGVPDDPDDPQQASVSRTVNWKLLGSALGLSIVAAAMVVMVRRFRKHESAGLMQPSGGFVASTDMSTTQRRDDGAYPNGISNRNNHNTYEGSLSEESSGGWASEDSQEQDDFVNGDNADNGTSVAEWSLSQPNELYLMSSQSSKSVV